MKKTAALGMYSIHKMAKENLLSSFITMREIGYTGIEFYGEPVDFPVPVVNKAIGESGLELTGWHIEWRNLQPDTFEKTVQYLKEVHCPIAVVPCLGGKWKVNHTPAEECRAIWEKYVNELNGIDSQLAQHGLRMGYHNHEHEFKLHYDGQSVFDILFENLKSDVVMELDTGNCIEGGGNPAGVIKKYGYRDILLHMKPYGGVKCFNVTLGDADDENDWKAILNAAPEKYLQLILESECETLPELENVQACYEGLKKYVIL
jgi:sugar phosphate isomerase/epimerase